MFDELWSEIQDMPGEIYDLDIPELKEEDFNMTEYINGDYDYWRWVSSWSVLSLESFYQQSVSTV